MTKTEWDRVIPQEERLFDVINEYLPEAISRSLAARWRLSLKQAFEAGRMDVQLEVATALNLKWIIGGGQ